MKKKISKMAAIIFLQPSLGGDIPSRLLCFLQKRSESLGPVFTQGKEITQRSKYQLAGAIRAILGSSCYHSNDLRSEPPELPFRHHAASQEAREWQTQSSKRVILCERRKEMSERNSTDDALV